MTRTEKVSLTLSIVGVVLSIIIPLASYFWLVPSIREYQLRGRLEVSGQSHNPTPVEQASVWNAPPYEINIRNIGYLPAKQIQITAQYPAVIGKPTIPFVKVDPPVQFDTNDTKSQIIIRQALAPNGTLKVSFAFPPVRVWVLNETGDLSIVETGAKDIIIMRDPESAEFLHNLLHDPTLFPSPRKSPGKK